MTNNVISIFPTNQNKKSRNAIFEPEKYYFEEEEALMRLEIIYNISKKVHQQINLLKSKIYSRPSGDPSINPIEKEIKSLNQKWELKMQKLGATPTGDLEIILPRDHQTYFFWKFPKDHFIIVDKY
jgi:hypothetical protein